MIPRREFLQGGLAGGALLASRGAFSAAFQAAVPDLVLVNGKFVDGRGVVGSTLTIKSGRILSVGSAPSVAGSRTIELGGRTVIPGLFDAHVHYTRAGVNPGYEARQDRTMLLHC